MFPDWTMAGALRSLDQDEIFMRYGIGKTIVPSRLKADTVVALAQDLMNFHADSRARAAG